MTDLTWLMFALWMVLLVVGYKWANKAMFGIGAVIGIIFGLTLFVDSDILGVILIILNLYFIYMAVFQMEMEEK